jgi:hypothetical protein
MRPYSTNIHAAEQVKRALLYSKLSINQCVWEWSCMTNQIFMQFHLFAVVYVFLFQSRHIFTLSFCLGVLLGHIAD